MSSLVYRMINFKIASHTVWYSFFFGKKKIKQTKLFLQKASQYEKISYKLQVVL